MKLSKKLCITAKKSFSLVLALTLMLSICAVSGMSLNVFAATSLDQKIYINLNKNKEWNGFSSVTCRFAQDDGTVLKTEKVSKDPSSGVFKTIAPSGATKIELSSGVNFTLPEKTVANGSRRIYLNNSNNTYNEAYAYSWVNDTDSNAEWPGVAMTKTSSDSGYYYVDVKSSHKNVIFSNKGETQTSDLGINDSYSKDNALYDASKSQWTNPFIKTIDISGASGDTEFYLTTDGSFKESKYLSVEAPDKQSKATYKTVYVSNDDWKSLTKVYATFDYNDAYEGTVELIKDTIDTKVSGSVVFSGRIPAGALLRFHPNEHNLNGASSATSYPTDSGYDGSGYNDNTATYVKTARGEGWTKFSEIDNVNYGAVVENSFKDNPNIVGVDATYFDYWSDMEQEKGYLQCQGQGNDNMYDYWYQFDNFNSYISNIASNCKSDWKYPLYFGNMYRGGEHYETFKTHAGGLTNINDYNDNYYYAVNNSNGMAWGNGNYNQSLQGLMYNRLDSKGNLQVANGVKAPYFDAEALSTATYNDKRVANVYKSSFPFRTTTAPDGVTTYEFTSKDATDNIYFTWDGLTPTKINYGAGEQFGVHDDLGNFGGTENGYGVFPFNNTQNTSTGKGTNDNLDYGFGIRLDIDFRVPKDGMLADNKPATFNFSGDDDLWVYIGEDSTGANAELALDLGGDHKEAKGSIDFSTMQATANDVFADYSPSSSSTKLTVPSGEFWVKTGDYDNFCLNVWQDTKVGVYNADGYYVDPYEISDGFYKFKKDLLGSNTEVNFCKWKNMGTGGTLKANLKLSDLYGKMWNGDGTPYTGDAVLHHTNLGEVSKKINGGNKLDPNKTYHMVVFYMERGEAESNFSVNFTMTPANNDLKVTKALDTGDVVSEISDDLKANETFDYTIKENGNDTSGKGYKLTKSDESESISSETLSNSGFTLKDNYIADFDNSFKNGNDMKVNESTNSSKLKYTTNWELVNNRVGSTIKSGSTTNSEFKLVDDKDDSAYAQLQLNYTNKIVTAPLEISKNVVDEDGTTDYDTNQQFTFAIALDFDGDGSTYDYKTYPLEYQLKEKGASDYSSTAYRTPLDGSFTIKKGESIKLLNIPVGATYKITEKNVIGYVPYKVGDQSFKGGTFEGTLAKTGNVLNFINKVNPTNIAISVNKTLDGQAYSGSKFVYTLTGLESMDTAKQDADGNIIKTNSAKTISTNLKTPDASGKVEFKDLKLVTAGVYRFKITEALAEGENASDYIMDTNTWLAEIELLENGKVTPPTYIKVSSSAIKDKTDAELAGYFNDPTSVKENEALFANETTHGSATVNKKNQTGGNVSDTEFAVMKVSDKDIFTADDINTIINDASMKTHMVSKKTDSNGQAVFDNLTIFKDGQGEFTKTNGKVVWNESSDNYISGTSTYQTYCLFEYKPSEGYNPNYTLSYFTLPVEGEYNVTYNYVDGAITMPSASGDGMNGYFVLGLSVAGLAVTMFTGYAIYYGKGRKKRRARRRK